MCAGDAGRHLEAEPAQVLTEALVERARPFRRRGRGEARATAPARVAEEARTGDDEQGAAHLAHREVHLLRPGSSKMRRRATRSASFVAASVPPSATPISTASPRPMAPTARPPPAPRRATAPGPRLACRLHRTFHLPKATRGAGPPRTPVSHPPGRWVACYTSSPTPCCSSATHRRPTARRSAPSPPSSTRWNLPTTSGRCRASSSSRGRASQASCRSCAAATSSCSRTRAPAACSGPPL